MANKKTGTAIVGLALIILILVGDIISVAVSSRAPFTDEASECNATNSGTDTTGTANPCSGLCSNQNTGTDTSGTLLGCTGNCNDGNIASGSATVGCPAVCSLSSPLSNCPLTSNAVHKNSGALASSQSLKANTVYCTGVTSGLLTSKAITDYFLVTAHYEAQNLNITTSPYTITANIFSGPNAPATVFGLGNCAAGGTNRQTIHQSTYATNGWFSFTFAAKPQIGNPSFYCWITITNGVSDMLATGHGEAGEGDIQAMEIGPA